MIRTLLYTIFKNAATTTKLRVPMLLFLKDSSSMMLILTSFRITCTCKLVLVLVLCVILGVFVLLEFPLFF